MGVRNAPEYSLRVCETNTTRRGHIVCRRTDLKMATFEEVWNRIVALQGEIFHTKTGLKFTYKIEGDGFCPSRTEYRIDKSDFEKACEMVPIEGPGTINNLVRGPAYIWAVLHDKRVSMEEW
jgi:hypothetical protein